MRGPFEPRRPAGTFSGSSIRSSALGLLLLLSAVATSPVAFAAPPSPRARAEALAGRGVDLFQKQRRFLEAAAVFGAAHALDPRPKYLWNQARAEEEGGELLAAARTFGRLAADPRAGKYRQRAQVKLAELQPKLVGALALRCLPEDAAFTAVGPAGPIEGRCPWQQAGLPAGAYRLSVRAPGRASQELTLQLAPGQRVEQEVALLPAPAPTDLPPPDEEQPSAPESSGPVAAAASDRGFPWVATTLAVAGVGLAAGATGLLLTRQGESTAAGAGDPEALRAANAQVTLGNRLQLGGFGLAGAAGATAALIWLLASPDDAAAATPLVLLPMPGGLALQGRF